MKPIIYPKKLKMRGLRGSSLSVPPSEVPQSTFLRTTPGTDSMPGDLSAEALAKAGRISASWVCLGILALFFFMARIPFADAMEHPGHERLKIKSLVQILPHIKPNINTVVFLDLDDTLFTLLTDGKRFELNELESPITIDVASIVGIMQNLGAKIFGLTARASTEECFKYTKTDLAHTGVVFNKLPDKIVPPPNYKDGVFFTSGELKGPLLVKLIENSIATDLGRVQKIIFVDDQEIHLNSVSACIASSQGLNNIPSIMAHFTAAEDLKINIMDSVYKNWNKYNKKVPEARLDSETIKHVCAKLRHLSNGCFPTEAYILNVIQTYCENYKDFKIYALGLKSFNINHRAYNRDIFLDYYEKAGVNSTVSSIDELLSHLPRSLKEFIFMMSNL